MNEKLKDFVSNFKKVKKEPEYVNSCEQNNNLKFIKMSTKPELIKAGDLRVKLGYNNEPPKVDIRVVAEDEYQRMIKLLERARGLVGNPGTNISSSTDFACEDWQKDYDDWMS